MRSGWTGNSLPSALSPAAAFGTHTAANIVRASKVKLKVHVRIKFKLKVQLLVTIADDDKGNDDQDRMQGAVE